MSGLLQIGDPPRRRHRDRPDWLRIRYRQTPELESVQRLVRDLAVQSGKQVDLRGAVHATLRLLRRPDCPTGSARPR